ncbi:MAG: YggS family pyridoxal phosphate-dependent enzyme [Urechidicola sp.]|nr:YggS family pyridoxal phosphate-dependent enzyme [Urechidicola sp.]
MSIADNLQLIKKNIPNNVTLVAVSKTKPITSIIEAYAAGQRVFGENKIQEMVDKQLQLPEDIQWHMIGHLQRNKVKYMASFVSLIHGVDSVRTLKEINKQAKKHDRVIDCLLQAKIATEDSKFGLCGIEIATILNSPEVKEFENIKIVGLMGMASFTNDKKQIKKEFNTLKDLFDKFKPNHKELKIISMGMSGDFKLAIEEGSNMIRVGSSIFGSRN